MCVCVCVCVCVTVCVSGCGCGCMCVHACMHAHVCVCVHVLNPSVCVWVCGEGLCVCTHLTHLLTHCEKQYHVLCLFTIRGSTSGRINVLCLYLHAM